MNEAYVSFETTKLLKEKGFDGLCCGIWHIYNEVFELHYEPLDYSNLRDEMLLAPTQQMAMRWLWEEKGLNVNAIYGDYLALKKSFWMPQIDSLDGCYGVDDEDFFREYDSREDCIEAALRYTLNNLI